MKVGRFNIELDIVLTTIKLLPSYCAVEFIDGDAIHKLNTKTIKYYFRWLVIDFRIEKEG